MGGPFMTVAVEQEKEMAEFGSESNNVNPSDYSCQVLLERTTLEAANDKSFPTDARLICLNTIKDLE